MLEKYFNLILVALVFVISLLSTLIFVLLKKMKYQKNKEEEMIAKSKEKEKFIIESLDIICKALIQEQCEISEGCIRIRMLLLRTDLINENKSEYQVFEDMYQEIKDLKTHEARNDLNLQQRSAEDKLRFEIENKYQTRFLDSSKNLHSEVKELL
jgi:hypothetical protein